MWRPQDTAEAERDLPDAQPAWHGFLLAEFAVEVSRKTGLAESKVGAVFTVVTTSLPELVTSIAAVRQGVLTLAVGGIIGGNAFDMLVLAFADIAYRGGSIYHAMVERHRFLLALSIARTGVLLLGLLRRGGLRHRRHRLRERAGPVPGRGRGGDGLSLPPRAARNRGRWPPLSWAGPSTRGMAWPSLRSFGRSSGRAVRM